MKFKVRGRNTAETVENVSLLTLFTAAVFTVVGVSVGTYVPGIPVVMAIAGAFLVLVSIALYITSELMSILSKNEEHKHHGGQP